MSTALRHPEILRIAQVEGKVTVDGLAAHFDVTLQTIRRDLSDLAASGQLERVHGGAVLASGTINIAYEERRSLNASAKSAIGALCAAQIPNGSCLYLSIGSTAEAVAEALGQHTDLMVVTNNTNVARILAPHPAAQVIVTGGALRHADGGLTGPLALSAIQSFTFDYAVMGCSAISPDGRSMDFDLNEVQIAQACLSHARNRYLIADTSKFTRNAPVRIAHLSEYNGFFSDAPMPHDLAQNCKYSGTEIYIT